MQRNGGLDILRVCAAALVFMVHSLLLVRYGATWDPIVVQGRLGVYLFFGLSGYLVFKPFAVGKASVPNYYFRRLLRILPAYLVALAVIAVLDGPPSSGWLRLLTFTQAWNAQPPELGFGVTWTLSVEMTFYALLPLLALTLGRTSWRGIAILAIASFVSLQILNNPYRGDAAWLLLWGFAPGMIVAILERDVVFPPWLALVGIAAAADAILTGSPPLMSVAAGLIIAGCTTVRISVPFARMLADASYSFYLLHASVIFALVDAGWSGRKAVLVAAGLTLAASLAVHRFVERPAQQLGSRVARQLQAHLTKPAEPVAGAAEPPARPEKKGAVT